MCAYACLLLTKEELMMSRALGSQGGYYYRAVTRVGGGRGGHSEHG